ncbi:hypothetical protein RRG08_066794 [Elysia crispata]|uniref:HAT C-terminal dimerisation domain-containing protein n=1 Tax=Elysia crispata TaxID=231223 RepID=A0AAE1CJT7_9GAST|nr:hypothetical protein RRG08_066794 [Elysia crispata]
MADMAQRDSARFGQLEYFIKRFPVLLPADSILDKLHAEFNQYTTEDISNLLVKERADEQWQGLASNKTADRKFKVLPRVMAGILSIPHSNAQCEIVFSTVRKNVKDFRGNLSCTNLQGFMILNQEGTICHERAFLKDLLRRCKSANIKGCWM